MKNRCRQILILCTCMFILTSCYDIDSLPDRITSDYSIAIPLVDTTVFVRDFADIGYYRLEQDTITIPANTRIHMGEQEYPFYIGNYSGSQEIAWIELLILINSDDLPANTIISVDIYTKNSFDLPYYLLSKDISLGESYSHPRIEKPTIDSYFRDARKIFLNTSLTFNDAVSVAQIMAYKVNVKFSIRFAMKTHLKITV
jgi:hypothetical protein